MISLIITSFEGRELLERTLQELEHSTDQWHEVVIVDCASQDGSPEMVRSRYPHHKLLALDKNVGFGTANNLGAQAAEGDFLLFLNSDAWPESGAIQKMKQGLDDDQGLALVAPRLRYPDGRLQFSWAPSTSVFGEVLQKLRSRWESHAWAHRRPPAILRPLIDQDWFTAACVLVRRTAFEAIGGFDESFFLYFEDVDLCLRLRQAGWRVAEVPTARAVHVKGGSNSRAGIDLAYRRSQLLYYRLHRPPWELRLLQRHLARKFRRVADPDLKHRLLGLLEP